MGILLLKSLIYGLLEGVTEWLPISSTGHLIILETFLSLQVGADVHPQFPAEFRELFLVAIQLGAVLAVVTVYHRKLFPCARDALAGKRAIAIWLRVLVGCLPAGIVGILADFVLQRLTGKDMDAWLYNAPVVALMLILYGVLFILIECTYAKDRCAVVSVEEMSFGRALGVGAFQMLALIPGTSRSGSTILGGMLLGLSRTAAAEFSFFMAVPVMAGACLVKAVGFASFMLQNQLAMPYQAVPVLLAAGTVAYVSSRFVIRFLMDFSSQRGFLPFGVYRILLGAAVLCYGLL